MGKKDKKKGKGAEKTAAKTEKKFNTKLKKKLALKGEEDIETLLLKYAAEDKQRFAIHEDLVEPPSKRSSFSLTPHPDKDQLILFGGEYFNGAKTFLYNDLFFYHIKQDKWIKVTSPCGPAPRSSHQAVAVSQCGGQLWVFGGEFTSPSQSQFYHYKDLWLFHFTSKKWEKITGKGSGPSSRSGHRMVCIKKHLYIFGGFHDNIRDYKFYNDVYSFSLEDFSWRRLEITGNGPCPRSACQMLPLSDGRIIIYGGYSKERVKKDVDKGITHTDMYMITPDKHDATNSKFRWNIVRQTSGLRPSPRCAFSMTTVPGDRAVLFGGVLDNEDDEDVEGSFYNDLYQYDMVKNIWQEALLSGKKTICVEKKRRRKEKADGIDEEIDEKMDQLQVNEHSEKVVSDDGVFTLTIGASKESNGTSSSKEVTSKECDIFIPVARINAGLCFKKGILYMFGGMFEEGDKQLTFNDFYSLDLGKLDEWKTIVALKKEDMEWLDSDSDSDTDMDDEEDEDDDDNDDDEELSDESEDEMDME